MIERKNLLWVDCLAGGVVGVVVLLIDSWLSQLYRLPLGLVTFMGVANLVYACYSFSLALRSERPLNLIRFLVVANLLWSVLLVILIAVFFQTASTFGLLFLGLEALFVGGLGILEWRSREFLRYAK